MEVRKMTKQPKRPTRQRKADRMIHAGISQEEIQCDYALGPFDRMAFDMDKKWGVDMLVELVSPETAQKYGSAMAKLNAAIDAQDPAMVAARAAVCMRGMQAMDAEATAAGKQPASDDVWILAFNGKQVGLLKNGRAWQRVQAAHPNLQLVTENDVILALEALEASKLGQMKAMIEGSFPQAEVTGFKFKKEGLEDAIPF
jgi:hypothetical protein